MRRPRQGASKSPPSEGGWGGGQRDVVAGRAPPGIMIPMSAVTYPPDDDVQYCQSLQRMRRRKVYINLTQVCAGLRTWFGRPLLSGTHVRAVIPCGQGSR